MKFRKILIGSLVTASFLSLSVSFKTKFTYFNAKAEEFSAFNGIKEEKFYENDDNFGLTTTALTNSPLKLSAKSAFSMEYDTETVIYSHNENERLPIASMCKIMTLLLCFEEIENGNLSLEEEITVSERAASMGGSQVFLEANAKYQVKELLKSIAVCSANDSCVAMAERISGDELLFTDKMNEKAKQLGATDTLFANCTGLPKEPQYSTAKDVARMLKELLKYDKYYEIGQVWMDTFQHPKGRVTEISNTNKLVKFYDGCDGGKTGFTNQAGYCLAATAKRNNLRIISVVIGEENSKTRFNDVKTTFDYAFANYSMKNVVDCNNPLEEKAVISGAKQKEISIKPSKNSNVFVKRGDKAEYTIETRIYDKLKAPLEVGETVGELIVFKDGVEIDRLSLVANESAQRANFFDKFKDIAKNWLLK